MKKLLIISALVTAITGCGDPAADAKSVAVQFCDNIAEANFKMKDIADPDVINAFQGLHKMNMDMYEHNISNKIDCSIKDVEEVKEEKSYKVAFENMNTVLVNFDEDSDSFKVQRQFQMTSNLF
ncbi:hypothetical protein [Pseudoalteromonas peptidolytica]|nr:hypothetical protein [Pseudoalteromonas peptidolytica]NLR15565.1 hypothetical protein [Pseudoalteromonas peptidolytica]GEK08319.1 hypothetical protein PPE03_05680 [Pseudoalteromonas peptidolytica]